MADQAQCLVSRWISNFTITGAELVVFSGPTGCGKTHCARAVEANARHIAMHGWESGAWDHVPSVLFAYWQEWVERIESERTVNALAELMETDLLLLDDLGAETDRYGRGKTIDATAQLLNRRAQNNKFTLITTNISPEKWEDHWDIRIADRLSRNSVVVDLQGVDSFSLRQ